MGKNIWNNTWYVLSKTWRYEKKVLFIIALQTVIGAVVPLAGVALPALVVNGISNRMDSGITVQIVTYRMGICRFVDKVIVLNKAHEIAGIGKHEELMETCETYRELYTNQAQWYLDGEIYG